MDDYQLKQAQATYKTLRETLDAMNLKYDHDDNAMEIISGAVGDDLPVAIRFCVDAERMLIILHSMLPFDVPQQRRHLMAVAVSRVNYGMADGSFDYDVSSGGIVFRVTSCYRDSLLGSETFEYMLTYAFFVVDKYNDLLEKIASSDMTLEEIINAVG